MQFRFISICLATFIHGLYCTGLVNTPFSLTAFILLKENQIFKTFVCPFYLEQVNQVLVGSITMLHTELKNRQAELKTNLDTRSKSIISFLSNRATMCIYILAISLLYIASAFTYTILSFLIIHEILLIPLITILERHDEAKRFLTVYNTLTYIRDVTKLAYILKVITTIPYANSCILSYVIDILTVSTLIILLIDGIEYILRTTSSNLHILLSHKIKLKLQPYASFEHMCTKLVQKWAYFTKLVKNGDNLICQYIWQKLNLRLYKAV